MEMTVAKNSSAPSPIRYRPIGIIRSPNTDPGATPIQPRYAADTAGRVEVRPEFQAGLADLEGFSHVMLVYHFHRAGPARLRVKPFLQDVEHGIFATRAPDRPNPIGVSVVELVAREGGVLHVRGLDVLDGTPLLDIKPYVSRFDCWQTARDGWQDEVDEHTAVARGRRAAAPPADAAAESNTPRRRRTR